MSAIPLLVQSFYFEDKPAMSNEEFDNLKEELLWEGSKVAVLRYLYNASTASNVNLLAVDCDIFLVNVALCNIIIFAVFLVLNMNICT